jgi:hypothetical protein
MKEKKLSDEFSPFVSARLVEEIGHMLGCHKIAVAVEHCTDTSVAVAVSWDLVHPCQSLIVDKLVDLLGENLVVAEENRLDPSVAAVGGIRADPLAAAVGGIRADPSVAAVWGIRADPLAVAADNQNRRAVAETLVVVEKAMNSLADFDN